MDVPSTTDEVGLREELYLQGIDETLLTQMTDRMQEQPDEVMRQVIDYIVGIGSKNRAGPSTHNSWARLVAIGNALITQVRPELISEFFHAVETTPHHCVDLLERCKAILIKMQLLMIGGRKDAAVGIFQREMQVTNSYQKLPPKAKSIVALYRVNMRQIVNREPIDSSVKGQSI